MRAPFLRPVPVLVLLTAACAQSRSYRRSIEVHPAAGDTLVRSYEARATEVLVARGYSVTEPQTGIALRAERTREGGRDVIYIVRSAVPYGADGYLVRFEYRVRAHSRYAGSSFGPLRPEVRADADRLTDELQTLRARGAPLWVGGLACAAAVAREEGFRISRAMGARSSRRPDYWSAPGERDSWPRLMLLAREPLEPGGGFSWFHRVVVAPVDSGGVFTEVWPPVTARGQFVRDRIATDCGTPSVDGFVHERELRNAGGSPPRPTEASASG